MEWIGPKDGERNVKVQLENQRKKIIVSDRRGKPLRMIDLRSRDKHVVSSVYIWISEKLLSVRAEGEIDLVCIKKNKYTHLCTNAILKHSACLYCIYCNHGEVMVFKTPEKY